MEPIYTVPSDPIAGEQDETVEPVENVHLTTPDVPLKAYTDGLPDAPTKIVPSAAIAGEEKMGPEVV